MRRAEWTGSLTVRARPRDIGVDLMAGAEGQGSALVGHGPGCGPGRPGFGLGPLSPA